MSFKTEIGDFPGTIIAKCIDNINPYTEKPETQLEVGKKYEVECVSMGQSHTSITLKGIGTSSWKESFNSIYFKFYENGKKLNIYRDKRFNPYL